jgi:glycosyltransferase involved in cell wall biosynthesis
MKVPKVAIQLVSTGGLYGAERALLELAGYLCDQGWESHVVALEGQGAGAVAERAAMQGLQAEAFVSGGRLGLLPMVARLRQLLARTPRAIVHSHGYKPDILLSWLRVPRRMACVATCHNWISDTLKLRVWEALDKRALKHFDHVVAVSPAIAQELVVSGVSPERLSVIDNGISVPFAEEGARAAVRAELNMSPDERLVVHIGRLARSKRIDVLLQAVAQLADARHTHLLLAGEGDQRASLAEQASRLGLEQRVHFCGYRSDVGRLLAAADLMVLSSEREGLPIAILEAMAARCPIVTTCVGAIPRVLTDGDDAWIVPANEPNALCLAINDALGRPEVATVRAENAYVRYARLYSRDSMGARYLRVYEEIWTRRQAR